MKKLKLISSCLSTLVLTNFLWAQVKDPSQYKTNTTGFFENKGQIVDQNYNANPDVKYLYHGNGLNLQLRGTGFSYDTYKTSELHSIGESTNQSSLVKPEGTSFPTLEKKKEAALHFHRVDIELVGCNTSAQIIAQGESGAYYNYFTSGTPEGGVSNVHAYQQVTYKNIYPNIDLVFSPPPNPSGEMHEYSGVSHSGGLMGAAPVEYNFIVHPGGNYRQIKLQYKGADGIRLKNDQILIPTSNGNVTESIPSSYLDYLSMGSLTGIVDKAQTRQPITAKYVALGNNTFGFFCSSKTEWDTNLMYDLIIDPTPNLLWASYYGATTGADVGYGIAVDASDNVYVTGSTGSATQIATVGAYQVTLSTASDAFVAKFNPSGSSLLWGTYYGGNSNDQGRHIALDASNNVYICGMTVSTSGIATAGAYQTTYGGNADDAFIAEFNSTGTSLLWGTYYGGAGDEYATSLALDASNNVYLTGITTSATQITTAGAYKTVYTGGVNGNVFVAKFNSTGSALLWGTYYGGSGSDIGYGIALDASKNVYVTGSTTSTTGIATAGAYQTILAGAGNAFIAKFNSTGVSLLWGTYYGGTGGTYTTSLALDAGNNIYVTGYTSSATSIATAGAYQTTNSGSDAFVAKFNSAGTSLLWGTYYGGSGGTYATGIALDASNNVYIDGYTNATGIATVGAYQTTFGGPSFDAFAAKFNSTGSSLLWGTYYGGSFDDAGFGIALDASGNVYITGYSYSTGLATAGAFQTTGDFTNGDAFVAKFSGCSGAPPQPGAISGPITVCNGSTITYKVAAVAGATTYTWTLPGGWSGSSTADSIIATVGASGGIISVIANNLCGSSAAQMLTVSVNNVTTSTTPVNILCNGNCNGGGTANAGGTGPFTYAWSNGQTNATATGLCANTFTVTVTGAAGCSATATAIITQPPLLTGNINSVVNVSCNGGNNGSAHVTAGGGSGAYTYSWNTLPIQTSANVTGLMAGTYTVTVTDNNGCNLTAGVTITQPTQLRDSIASQSNVLCNGGNSGSATLGVKGGTGGYTYAWAPSGGSSASASGLAAGSYTCTITDANGCNASASATITEPSAPGISAFAGNSPICPGYCTSVNVSPRGGTPGYAFMWSTGSTSSADSVCPVVTSSYTVTVTDTNGCSQTASVNINVDSLPKITLKSTADTICVNVTKDSLIASPAGGTFSGIGVTGNNFNPNVAGSGIHKVFYTYIDSNGCTSKDSMKIVVGVCTGIEEANLLDNRIRFYPNPFSHFVNVDIGVNGPVRLTIFNMCGENVGTWQLDKGLNSISTEAYPPGVYLLQIKTKDGILNKKLVKVD
jgi:hypothetical protein